MNLSRPAAVFTAVVLLTGGAAIAVNAATATNPVKLCSNNTTRVVEGPAGNGACQAGTTTFYVARAADVQALANRMGAAESAAADAATAAASQAAEIDALKTENAKQKLALQDLSNADKSLSHRLATLEGPGTLTLDVSPPTTFPNEFNFTLAGSELTGGALVVIHYTIDGVLHQTPNYFVDDDGTINRSGTVNCVVSDYYMTSVRANGNPISTEVFASGPGCP